MVLKATATIVFVVVAALFSTPATGFVDPQKAGRGFRVVPVFRFETAGGNHPAVDTSSTTTNTRPRTWQMFFDLQCPYSRKVWSKVPELRERFGHEYSISLHTTSLAFHRQAFSAQTAAYLIGTEQGPAVRERFQTALYDNMERYVDAVADEMTRSMLHQVLADIAKEHDILDTDEHGSLTERVFLEKMMDRENVIMPAWREHKEALQLGVFRAPQHVVDGKLVPDTESSWEIQDYERALDSLVQSR